MITARTEQGVAITRAGSVALSSSEHRTARVVPGASISTAHPSEFEPHSDARIQADLVVERIVGLCKKLLTGDDGLEGRILIEYVIDVNKAASAACWSCCMNL